MDSAFLHEPLLDKPIYLVPGVNSQFIIDTLKREFGATKAIHLLGIYLKLNKKNELFVWELAYAKIPLENVNLIVSSLTCWCHNHI